MPLIEKISRRRERVAGRIMEEVARRLAEVDDRNLGFTTITGCDVSPDLRHARIEASILGDEAKQAAGLLILGRLLRRWRGGIGRALGTRVVPELAIALDDSLERSDRIGRLIREARASDPNPGAPTPETEAALAAAVGTGLSPAVERLAGQAAAGRFLDDADFDDQDEATDEDEECLADDEEDEYEGIDGENDEEYFDDEEEEEDEAMDDEDDEEYLDDDDDEEDEEDEDEEEYLDDDDDDDEEDEAIDEDDDDDEGDEEEEEEFYGVDDEDDDDEED